MTVTTPPTMAATPMAHRRESPVVGLIFSSLKKRSIHKKRASRPVVCFDQSPVVSEKVHTDDFVCSEEASSPPAEATRLHLPSISPAQCHMLHFAHKERPHSPAKLPAGCLPRLQQPSGRHTLLLDLDHTLINTHPSKPTTGVAGIDWLKLELPRHAPTYVSVRPHLAEFVRELQRLPYDLSVFTASSEAVAGPKLDWLETRLIPWTMAAVPHPSTQSTTAASSRAASFRRRARGCSPVAASGSCWSRTCARCCSLVPTSRASCWSRTCPSRARGSLPTCARLDIDAHFPLPPLYKASPHLIIPHPYLARAAGRTDRAVVGSVDPGTTAALTAHCPTCCLNDRAPLHVLQATLATRHCQDCSRSSPTSPRVPTCARSYAVSSCAAPLPEAT